MRGRRSRGVCLEDTLDDDAVEMDMRIEQRAKAVEEGDRANPGIGTRSGAGAAQGLLYDVQENAQRQGLDGGIVLQVIPQPLGDRQYPLAHRQSRKVGQVGSGFDHSPGVAGGTDPAALARAGDEKSVATLAASSAGKAMRENAAFEIPPELAFNKGWPGYALAAIAGEFEPGGEVRLA